MEPYDRLPKRNKMIPNCDWKQGNTKSCGKSPKKDSILPNCDWKQGNTESCYRLTKKGSIFPNNDWEQGNTESCDRLTKKDSAFSSSDRKKKNMGSCSVLVERGTQTKKKDVSYPIDGKKYAMNEESPIKKQITAYQKPITDNADPNKERKNLQSDSNITKSTMQIMEDHLLSKVYIRRLYGGIYLYNGKYYVPLTEQEYMILLRRESDEGILSILKNYRAYSDAYRFLAINPDIEFEDYDKLILNFKTIIAFDNTLIDAKTGRKFKHSEDYPVFFGTNIHYKDEPGNTPYWDKFVESVAQGESKIKELIYEMLGYLLLQGNDGKCFFVLASAPNSGKSVLGDFISSIFQDCYISHMAIDDFGKRFSLGGLWRTVLNISMDLPQSTLSTDTVSLIKTLTGDSKIAAEEKYAPRFTALNHVKLVFGTNSRLLISASDPAFWNRVIIVPFQHEIPRQQRDTDLLSHLLDEKDDIFSKCIPYVTKLIERKYEFTTPDISNTMHCDWAGNKGEPIGDFFSKYCEIAENSSGLAVQEVYENYKLYCSQQKVPDRVSDIASFSKLVRQKNPDIEVKKCRVKGYNNPVSVFKNLKCSYHQNIMEGG